MISFHCPQCDSRFETDDSMGGRHVACEVCGCHFSVPMPPDTARSDSALPNAESGRDGLGDPRPQPSFPSTNEGLLQESADADRSNDSAPNPEKLVISFDDEPQSTEPLHDSGGESSTSQRLSPRQRRLLNDCKAMVEHFSTFPSIHIESMQGNPPERYVVAYEVRGIERVEGSRIVYRNHHEVEIKLPGTYPRTQPLCRMLTPVFHPNIEPAVICIGDHWTAAERLCDLVVRIGEIISYQAYNIRSPLDGEAAMWADIHSDMLPIDSRDLTPPDL